MTKLLSLLLLAIWLLLLLSFALASLMGLSTHEADGATTTPDAAAPDSHATGCDGQTSRLPAPGGITVPAISHPGAR